MKITSFVIAASGFSMLVLGAYLLYQEVVFLSRAASASGTVARMQTALDIDKNTLHCPVIAFHIRTDAETHWTTAPCSAPAAYNVGEHVALYYDPRDPHHAQVQDFNTQYIGPILCAFIGLPFLILGMWGLFSGKK